MSSSPFLYPNVTSLPGQRSIGDSANVRKPTDGKPGEFDQVFERTLEQVPQSDLNQLKQPLKFSAHASQRLQDRNIKLSQEMMGRVNEALDKAEAKGIEDTLVLTPDAALIVSVKNRTVITALDRSAMTGNVFSNIDGAVIV